MTVSKLTFFLKIFIFLVLSIIQILFAQSPIKLPSEISIEINDSERFLSTSWIDTLADDAINWSICYKIVGAKRSTHYILSNIQIPQILTLDDVLRQIVIYYALLPNEDEREKEILSIFPYFESIEGLPAIRVHYMSHGKYDIELNYWNRVSVPDPPIPEDKYIFNQVLQLAFNGIQSLGDVPDSVFKEVATKNNLSMERIRNIYQNTILWQTGCQLQPVD
jgi:hypothetical protein